jgi:hypothetical protein
MLRTLLSTTGTAVAVLTAPTQVTAQNAPGRLIGYAAEVAGPVITPPMIQRQQLCNPTERVCPSPVGSPAADWAGGLAYNAMRGSVWHTQGSRMAETRIGDCALLCSVPANLTLGVGSLATGLALSEENFALYQLESLPGAAALHTFHIRSCPPQVIASCRIQLPSLLHVAGAVEIDRRNGFVFYASSVFSPITPVGPQNTVLVAQLSDPCNIVCRFPVDGCGAARLGPIRGMAYDDCDGTLFLTDGKQTVTMRRSGLSPCSFQEVLCCQQGPPNQLWFGLDIEAIHARPIGQSCLGPGCRPCPNMELVAHGDPTVGNPQFALSIVNGEQGARAFLWFNIGQCRPQNVPFLCGPFYPLLSPPPAVLTLGPLSGGVAGCDASATLPIPVPVDYSLCGGQLCFQGLVLCAPSLTAIGLTNGLQIVVDA